VTDENGNEMTMDINGTSPPIHEMNRKSPPNLKTRADAMRYLKFFCHAVHGDEGAFALCESDDIVRAHTPPSCQENAEALKFNRSLERGDDGHWLASTVIRYHHALFQAKLRILPTGMVEMLEDIPILEWEHAPDARPFASDSGIYFYAPRNR
jgi:hypothetical protein